VSELDLDALQAMVDMASPGPWRVTQDDLSHPAGYDVYRPSGLPVAVDTDGYEGCIPVLADAEFIAAAREAMPALIDRVRELERKNLQQGMMLAGLLSKSDRDDAHIAELEAARDQP